MIVRELELTNYRSYTYCRLQFDAKMNVFVGENGSGKTNLVEAIHFLSLARSFRTSEDQHLVKKGTTQTRIKALIEQYGVTKTVDIHIGLDGKKILVNFKPIVKLSHLSDVLNVLVFEPRDVMIFDDSPKVRRRFLDITLMKQSTIYFEKIVQYERVLKERNDLLKHPHIDLEHLNILTNQLIELSEPIVTMRQTYLVKMNDVLAKIVGLIKGEAFNVNLHYVPYLEPGTNFLKRASVLFEKNVEQDLKRRTTTFGVHREDFVVVYDNQAIASFGSQGENRLVALALKLAPYFMIDDHEKRPVIVLDDVLSELDEQTQQRLLTFLEKLQQVFITTTHYPTRRHTQYTIQENTITRRL